MAAPLQLTVEVAFNAGYRTAASARTWTDLTDYVEGQSKITIGYGRSDELGNADANRCNVSFDNRDGRFTLDNPASPYYPNVLIGRPLRVLLGVAPNPDFEVDLTGWSATNAALARVTTPVRSGVGAARLTASTAATMAAVTPTGTSAQPVVPFKVLVIGAWFRAATAARTCNVKATWYNAAGSPISTVTVATGTDSTAGYTRIRGEVTAPANAAFVSRQLEVVSPAAGEIHYVDDPELSRYRFCGYVDSWPVEFPGGSESYATASVNASSRMSRIGLDSPRAHPLDDTITTDLAASYYWPITEAKDAPAASEIRQRAPGLKLEPLDPAYGVLEFGAGGKTEDPDDLGDGRPALKMTTLILPGRQGEAIVRNLPTPLPTSGAITIGVFVKVLFPVTTGGAYYSFLSAGSPAYTVIDLPLSNATYPPGSIPAELSGTHFLAYVFERTSPSAIAFTIYLDGVAIDSGSSLAGTIDDVSQIRVAPPRTAATGANDLIVGRLGAWSRKLTPAELQLITRAGLAAYSGDTTAERFTRYAGWARIAAGEFVSPSTGIPVSGVPLAGGQILSLMRQMETTEAGVLHDDREGRLVLEARSARYAAPTALTIDVGAQLIGRDYAPKGDRQGLANYATAKNALGTVEVTVTDEASRNEYGDATYSVETHALDPDEPLQLASARISAYSTPKARVPSGTIEILDWTGPDLAAVLSLDIGSKVTLTNRPAAAGPSTVEHFVEGYTETLTPFQGSIALNLSPSAPVGDYLVLDSAIDGVLDQNRIGL
jgi:hypothetical protein